MNQSNEKPIQHLNNEEAEVINRMCIKVNDWATSKGWNEKPDSIEHQAEQIALMHSELSEALESLRKKEQPAMDDHCPSIEGVAAEFADTIIRIFHYCGKRGIDLGNALVVKHDFNLTRPYQHGKRC